MQEKHGISLLIINQELQHNFKCRLKSLSRNFAKSSLILRDNEKTGTHISLTMDQLNQ
jgi:hypothetical protein